MERQTLRTVAAVLVFVFLLLTIWAGYNLLSDLRASGGTTSTTLAVYGVNGQGNFTASLLPNDLCNCSQASGGNATLFPAITQTINMTLTTAISVSTPASIGTTDGFTVVLSTAAWTKQLYAGVNQSSFGASALAQTLDRYSINVSSIEALVALIDDQLHYQASQASLTLTSTVVSTISVRDIAGYTRSSTTASVTFFPSTIAVGFTGASASGSIVSTTSADASVPTLVYLYIILALAGVGGSIAWLASLRPRSTDDVAIPPLDDLVAPFEEVIAKTASPPNPGSTITVDRWEDLVKISDTLGKPILRAPSNAPDSTRGTFYVLDGSVGYLYRYGSAGTPTGVSAWSARSMTMTDHLRTVSARIRAFGPEDPRFEKAVEQLRQLCDFLRARQWIDADRAFDDLEAVLNAPPQGPERRR